MAKDAAIKGGGEGEALEYGLSLRGKGYGEEVEILADIIEYGEANPDSEVNALLSEFAEETDVDKGLKMLYDKSDDRTEFERYKERLGPEAPKSFSDFQKIKYGNVDKYSDLIGYYKYKGDNPNSNINFYDADKAVKELRVSGQIRATGVVTIAPKDKTIIILNVHAVDRMQQRHITIEKAQSFIDGADFVLKQRNGTQYAYYTEEGFTVLDDNGEVKSVGFLDEGGKFLYERVMRFVKGGK